MMNWNTLLSQERLGGALEKNYTDKNYINTEFEKDYRRIVSSASFRRLQDKTQVFPLDKNDFIRTRLTHSLETASIAKQLGIMAQQVILGKETDIQAEDIRFIPDILLCAGILHDIGNPPFGHFGETIIGDWFKNNLSEIKFKEKTLKQILKSDIDEEGQPYHDLIHFEGNAQALRLVTKLHYLDNEFGLNLTASVLNTLVKYPCSSLSINSKHKNIKFHKMGYYFADMETMENITNITKAKRNDEFLRHPLTFLLEAADDIAYTTADLEDAYKKGLFTLQQLKEFIQKNIKGKEDYYEDHEDEFKPYIKKQLHFSKESLDKLIDLSENKNDNGRKNVDWYAIQNWINYIRNWLMYCVTFGFDVHYDALMKGTYEHELIHQTNQELIMLILKDFMGEYVFPDRSIITLELAAKSIMESLLDKFVHAVLYYDYKDEHHNVNYKMSKADKKLVSLLSQNHKENYKKEAEGKSEEEKLYLRLLLVIDFISGMTDTYAKQIYQELNGIY